MSKFIVIIDKRIHVNIEADSLHDATLVAARDWPDAHTLHVESRSDRHTSGVLAIARRHPRIFDRLTRDRTL